MPSILKTKKKVFQIAYKSFYHELSDWQSEYIKAATRKDALRIFASRHKIGGNKNKPPQQWHWWDGDWYMHLRFIRQVKQEPKPCPHCHGTGYLVRA